MTAPSKKPAPTLLAAVRRFVANGGTWEEFIAWTAPEFGAVMREGQISGWSKPKIVYGDVEVSDEDLDNAAWFVDGKETKPPKRKRKAAAKERRR